MIMEKNCNCPTNDLDKLLTYRITKFMEITLDYGQIAVPPDRWVVFRSKILRAGNDTMRSLRNELGLMLTGSSEDPEGE